MIASHTEDKLALLLQLLGDQTAETLLARLRPQRAASLRARMQSLHGAVVPPRRQEEILADFERLFQLAARSRGPRLRIAGDGADASEDPAGPGEGDWQPFEPGDDPQQDLERLTPHQIALCLETEHPRTAAIVLQHLSSTQGAAVMRALSDSMRQSTIVELSKSMPENANLVRQVLRATVRTAVKLPPVAEKQVDVVQRIADMLRASEKPDRAALLEALQTHHPETAAQVQERLYDFQDLIALDNRAIQRVLAEVDTSTLALAAIGAEPALIEKIMGNLSKRARETLRDEMEFQSAARSDAIAGARKSVVQILAKVDQESS